MQYEKVSINLPKCTTHQPLARASFHKLEPSNRGAPPPPCPQRSSAHKTNAAVWHMACIPRPTSQQGPPDESKVAPPLFGGGGGTPPPPPVQHSSSPSEGDGGLLRTNRRTLPTDFQWRLHFRLPARPDFRSMSHIFCHPNFAARWNAPVDIAVGKTPHHAVCRSGCHRCTRVLLRRPTVKTRVEEERGKGKPARFFVWPSAFSSAPNETTQPTYM